MAETSEIIVRFIPADKWWKRSKWELYRSYKSANGEIEAHAGFISDGASIPYFLRSLFAPTGRYFGAAIVHDYVLQSAPQPASAAVWDLANRQFKDELKALNIKQWRLWVLLNGVRGWAKIRTQIIDPIKKFFRK